MTQRERIARFERLLNRPAFMGGVYTEQEYLDRFSPKKDWAEDIAAFSSGNFPNRKSAKNAGPGLCRVRRFTIQ